MDRIFNLKSDATFTEVESYIKNQLIGLANVDVDFFLAKGNTYIFNVCIGGVNMFHSDVVRLTSRAFNSDKYESFVFNIIIRSDMAVEQSLIVSLIAYSKMVECYVKTRDYDKDFAEWEKYEKEK